MAVQAAVVDQEHHLVAQALLDLTAAQELSGRQAVVVVLAKLEQ
jgi:hypothetical protein